MGLHFEVIRDAENDYAIAKIRNGCDLDKEMLKTKFVYPTDGVINAAVDCVRNEFHRAGTLRCRRCLTKARRRLASAVNLSELSWSNLSVAASGLGRLPGQSF